MASSPGQPSLDVVVVNWNTGPALRECLQSIRAARAGVSLDRVVTVDNASTDDSLTLVDTTDLPLVTIRNVENRGFAAACNQGARDSAADYLLFLNPDTVLESETLSAALDFMQAPSQQDVGICGIRLVDGRGHPTTTAARFPTPRLIVGEATGLSRLLPAVFPRHLLTAGEVLATRDVDQVIGAFFLIRRTLFESLAGFDERFFVYYEEVDLSLRARRAGFRSTYFHGARALHHGGVSSDQVRAARLFYSLRGRLLYADKHFSRLGAWVVWLVTFYVEQPMRRLRAATHGRQAGAETAEGYRRLAAFVAQDDWRQSRAAQRRP